MVFEGKNANLSGNMIDNNLGRYYGEEVMNGCAPVYLY